MNKSKSRKKVIIIVIIIFLVSIVSAVLLYIYNNQNEKDKLASFVKYLPKEINAPLPTYEGEFELPVEGAKGYVSTYLNITDSASSSATIKQSLNPGDSFTILKEEGTWWKVKSNKTTGWINNSYCFINLPDVIPSIIYKLTNVDGSIFKSQGKNIPGLTGESLYDSKGYNSRLKKDEYWAGALYPTAKMIYKAQQKALSNNETLIIYESFRPYEVQRKVVEKLSNFASTDSQVLKGISSSPWNISWFIAGGISNHQRGIAIDVSLGKVTKYTSKTICGYKTKLVKSYDEYTMPSPIHELSSKSVSMKYPVSTVSPTAWRNVPVADSMNDSALRLRDYAVYGGMTPIASEWWHFNDLTSLQDPTVLNLKGAFVLH